MTNTQVNTYRSAKTLANYTHGLFLAIVVLNIVVALVGAIATILPNGSKLGSDGAGFNLAMSAVSAFAAVEQFATLAVIVTFLMWLFRCYKNLEPLNASSPEFTPGWAVGFWFIPFMSLYKPFRAVRDLWNESDPNYDPDGVMFKFQGGAPALISFWWAAFLLHNFLANLPSVAMLAQKESTMTVWAIALAITNGLTVVAAFLAMRIVVQITQRQDARFKNMPALSGPPSPPTFN